MNKKYIIQEGPAKGLIHKVDVDNAIIDEVTCRIRPAIKTAKDLADINLQRDVVAEVIKSLENKVYSGTTKSESKTEITKDESGNEVKTTFNTVKPKTTSPQSCGIAYTTTVLNFVEREIIKDFAPYTPTLEHSPDKRAFAEACSKLFPNICDPWECAESLRQFCGNLHHSCKTPGARFVQKCLWLVSLKTGFTGKSHFLINLQEVLNELGVDNIMGGFDKDWFDPVVALHTVLLVNDLDTLPSTHILNGLVDRTTFHYNKKGGATGNVTSCTNLIVSANIEPWKQNRRRYNMIHFPAISVDDLSATERAYFPFWNDNAGYQAAIKELIRTCPFDSAFINPNETLLREKSEQYVDILGIVQSEAKRRTHQHLKTRMMPKAFVAGMIDLTPSEEKAVSKQLEDFLAQAQNERKLVETGMTPAWRREIDFSQFLKWECGVQTDDEVNWLEQIHNKWDDLIETC